MHGLSFDPRYRPLKVPSRRAACAPMASPRPSEGRTRATRACTYGSTSELDSVVSAGCTFVQQVAALQQEHLALSQSGSFDHAAQKSRAIDALLAGISTPR